MICAEFKASSEKLQGTTTPVKKHQQAAASSVIGQNLLNMCTANERGIIETPNTVVYNSQ